MPMEENRELLLAIRELTEENRKQQVLLEKQCRATRTLGILLVCLVAVVGIAMFTLLPKVTATLKGFDTTLNELNVVVENTQIITEELKSADIEGTIHSFSDTLNSVNGLVEDSADSLTTSLKKLEELDIDTLNKAIQGLYKVVNPLSSLFGR